MRPSPLRLYLLFVLLGVLAGPYPVAAGPAAPFKPLTIPELISRLDDNVAAAMREDGQLAQEENTIPQQMKVLRAEQLTIVNQEEQIKAVQDRLTAQLKDADDELAKVRAEIKRHNDDVETWNSRCDEARVGKLPAAQYQKCQDDKVPLVKEEEQLRTLLNRWLAQHDTLQAQYDKNDATFRSLVAEWFARDGKLKQLAARLQQIKQRRAAIADNIKRLRQLRAKMVAAKCPAAKTGTPEELKLKCGNVQFDNADPNVPALEDVCPTCIMPAPKSRYRPGHESREGRAT